MRLPSKKEGKRLKDLEDLAIEPSRLKLEESLAYAHAERERG